MILPHRRPRGAHRGRAPRRHLRHDPARAIRSRRAQELTTGLSSRARRSLPRARRRSRSGGRSSSIPRAARSTTGCEREAQGVDRRGGRLDPPRAATRRSLVLPRRLVRAARAVAGAARPATGGRAQRQSHRVALERTVALDPELHDAYFGIGMYHYWADVAPVAAKLLRVLLLLPGGDREKGLREMLRGPRAGRPARRRSRLPAALAVSLVRARAGARAASSCESLDARYPSNPVFLQRIAEIEHDYRHDHRASAAAWEALLARAQAGTVERASDGRDARASRPRAASSWSCRSPSTRSQRCKSSSRRGRSRRTRRSRVAQFRLGVAYERLGQSRSRDRGVQRGDRRSHRPTILANIRARSREALRKKPRRRDRSRDHFFDKTSVFVLDIAAFSTIIYIWYEGGQLRPFLVRLSQSNLTLADAGSAGAEGATRRRAPTSG